jgi:hypothetical protein
VLILGTIVDEHQEARGRQTRHEAIEQGLGLGVDPVEVLEDDDDRLGLGFRSSRRLLASSVW